MAPFDDATAEDIPLPLRRLFANVATGNGNAPDSQPAPSPAPFFAGASATPPIVPTPGTAQPEAPQMGLPDEIAARLPWMPQYRQAQLTRPAMTTATGQMVPGLTKGQKLGVLLTSGLKGALAGRAASEQAVAQSGGHRSAGVGTGFEAGYFEPSRETANAQALERAGLENQILGSQAQYAPQVAALGAGKTIADILKSRAEAGKATAETGKATAETAAIPTKQALEQAQALAARYKEDPGSGSLIDLQTGQPVNGGQMIPVQGKEFADVLNVPVGTQVPIQRLIKAAELLTKGITTTNTAEGVFERNRITGTNTRLGDNPREISLDTPVGALDNSTGKQVMVTRKDIIGSPGRYSPVSADVSTPVIKQTLKEYASTKPGTAGGTAIAFNTAMAHLGMLNDAIDALDNGNIKILNSISQRYKTETGSAAGTTYDTLKQAVSGELAKVTGSLSQGEQEAIKGPLDKANSPAALRGAVRGAVRIMDGKIGALHQHYVDIMHEEPDAPLIQPEAQKVRDKLLGGANSGQIQVTDPNGGVHTFADQASADKFKQLAGIR